MNEIKIKKLFDEKFIENNQLFLRPHSNPVKYSALRTNNADKISTDSFNNINTLNNTNNIETKSDIIFNEGLINNYNSTQNSPDNLFLDYPKKPHIPYILEKDKSIDK